MDTIVKCVEKFFPADVDVQDNVVNIDFLKYKDTSSMFERKLAILKSRNTSLSGPDKLMLR